MSLTFFQDNKNDYSCRSVVKTTYKIVFYSYIFRFEQTMFLNGPLHFSSFVILTIKRLIFQSFLFSLIKREVVSTGMPLRPRLSKSFHQDGSQYEKAANALSFDSFFAPI